MISRRRRLLALRPAAALGAGRPGRPRGCSCSSLAPLGAAPRRRDGDQLAGALGVLPVMSRALLRRSSAGGRSRSVLLYIGVAMALVATAQYVPQRAGPSCSRSGDPQPELERWCLVPVGMTRAAWTRFPDLGSLSDQELKDLIQQLTDEEVDISYRRRILHGKIDILRAELVNRLRKKHEGGEDVITGDDVQRLTDILAGRASTGEDERGTRLGACGPPLPRVRLPQRRRRQLLPELRVAPRPRRTVRASRRPRPTASTRRRASSSPSTLERRRRARARRSSSARAAAAWGRASRSTASA